MPTNNSMVSIFSWFTSQHGLATLDFLAGILMGIGIFDLVIGKENVKRVLDKIESIR